MRITFPDLIADAWRLWREDSETLTAITGLFIFLPVLALALLVQPTLVAATRGIDPKDAERVLNVWLDALSGQMHWVVLAQAATHFGTLTATILYLDRDRLDVRAALRRALGWLPFYLLAMVLVSLVSIPGLLLFVIGYFYLFARMALTGPVMIAERQPNPLAAIARSFALTRHHGFTMTGTVMTVLLAGFVAQWPFSAIDQWMDLNAPNPIARGIVDIGGAAVAALGGLALVLVQIAAYRRLADQPGLRTR